MIKMERGIQFTRSQIRAWVWFEEKMVKTEGYHYDQNEERNLMD
jgi:hypothetical protein